MENVNIIWHRHRKFYIDTVHVEIMKKLTLLTLPNTYFQVIRKEDLDELCNIIDNVS